MVTQTVFHNKIYIDRILYPVTALGPGKRIGIWVSGCSRHCYRCANPELWERRPRQVVLRDHLRDILAKMILEKQPDGITITGGEPFEQSEELSCLLKELSDMKEVRESKCLSDILIYSGYQKENIEADPIKKSLLDQASVLIDGSYIDEKNHPDIILRGSANQRILYLNGSEDLCIKYNDYMKQGRQIQNFVYDYSILSVGIHSRNSNEQENQTVNVLKNK